MLMKMMVENMKKVKAKNSAILNSSLAYLPLKLYLTAYFDAGYTWDNYFLQNNQLKNKWQFGFGMGLNLVKVYQLSTAGFCISSRCLV